MTTRHKGALFALIVAAWMGSLAPSERVASAQQPPSPAAAPAVPQLDAESGKRMAETTQQQIQANMNVELSGSETGLVAYYDFNEGSGQIAGDSSASGNDSMLGTSSAADSADPTWVDAP